MKSQFFTKALTFGLSAAAIILTGCSTTESRISEHPDLFNTLSPRDQQLVQQGQIRSGMTQNAVWLAWGSPDQKAVGNMRGTSTETWIYMETTTAPYGSYRYPYYGYPYRYGYGGIGFGAVGGVYRSHGHHGRFVVFGDPFYDPFFYSYIPPTVSYPEKIVTFANGRVMSFQYLVPPYR
jgi:outer membrane protein assembly factor BamE (lipoprotein component of BamABCDE complex)